MLANLLLLSLALAQAQAPACENIKTHKEFYQCSLLRHPEVDVAKLKSAEGQARVEESSQLQNPELEVKSLRGESEGLRAESTEVSLSLPLSQFWTRGSRKDIGAAQKRLADIEVSDALLSVRKNLIHDLYRLRQIDDELQILSESLQSFESLRKQFRSRAVRGPEQEVTLNLIELATSDYELKTNHLVTERAKIHATFKALWGPDFKISKAILPGVKESWPEISAQMNVAQSFQVRKILAESEKAQAEKQLADKEAWPTVSAGPTIEQTNDGSNRITSYGVNLNMSLPLLSLNQGVRKVAATRAEQASLLSSYAIKKASAEKEVLIQKYQSSISALKKASNKGEVHKKHQKIDGLFKQGLVGGSLVIEAHRQIVDFTESQHAHELSAVEAFMELKTLSGEGVEEILQ